ncbi:unnamed protein product [Meganyctiphanes norvegica]|uniref:Uncharacterized protein n=1 Tax=Meganyctiphanes norvegica TaxID=48144 RepID=A0AAV2QN21_MEGNR
MFMVIVIQVLYNLSDCMVVGYGGAATGVLLLSDEEPRRRGRLAAVLSEPLLTHCCGGSAACRLAASILPLQRRSAESDASEGSWRRHKFGPCITNKYRKIMVHMT